MSQLDDITKRKELVLKVKGFKDPFHNIQLLNDVDDSIVQSLKAKMAIINSFSPVWKLDIKKLIYL